MSLHPSSRFWCHSSELLELHSWLFIPGRAFVVWFRWGSDTRRIGGAPVKPSADCLRQPFRAHHRNSAPAASCSGERNGKVVTIDTIRTAIDMEIR